MFKNLKEFIKRKNKSLNKVDLIQKYLESSPKNPKVLTGKLLSALNNQKQSITNLSEVEFQVFSQWGDDGIIQYLVNKIDITHKVFVEFGVENYVESNTRFLLMNDNWKGLVIDGSATNVTYIKNDTVSWGYDLYSECAFITTDNINTIINRYNFPPEIGILSVDIDGNDYWVLQAIDCINPIIIIVEYNSVFGKNTFWSVPYDPSFVRSEKHSSNLYYGASLGALYSLATEKGYSFIGCNSKGNNAYFIRRDKVSNLPIKELSQGYVYSNFREAMINGNWVTGENRIRVIEGMNVVDIKSGEILKIDAAKVQY